MKNNKEELVRLIKENPTLPLVFFTDNDTIADDYSSTFRTDYSCYKSMIYVTEERIFDDKDDVLECLSDLHSDNEKYQDFWEEEYDRAMLQELAKLEQYEAIAIHVS